MATIGDIFRAGSTGIANVGKSVRDRAADIEKQKQLELDRKTQALDDYLKSLQIKSVESTVKRTAEGQGALRSMVDQQNQQQQVQGERDQTYQGIGPRAPGQEAKLPGSPLSPEFMQRTPEQFVEKSGIKAYGDIPGVKEFLAGEETRSTLDAAARKAQAEAEYKRQKDYEERRRWGATYGQSERKIGLDEKRLDLERTKAAEKVAPVDEAKKTSAENVIGLTDEIAADPAFAVGLNPMRLAGVVTGTKTKGFNARVDRLKGALQLDIAGKLKGQGQISDKERQMLREAATILSTDLNEEDFMTEINRIRSTLGAKHTARGPSAAATPTTSGLSETKRALAQEALNDPNAPEAAKAQARRLLGL
jgi:hypothetical protein